jgi:hypothetical protein
VCLLIYLHRTPHNLLSLASCTLKSARWASGQVPVRLQALLGVVASMNSVR